MTTQRQPGKFEGCSEQGLGKRLYTITVDGGCADELGDVQDFGWYGLVEASDVYGDPPYWYIVSEDSQGFFDYETFDNEKLARAAWTKLEEEYDVFCSEDNDESA